jgi:agmatinase
MSPAIAELASNELHRGPLTFMGAPFSHDLSAAKAAILGAPFDCGLHLFRIGARQGPQSIREQSRLVRPFQSEFADFDIRARLGLVDCGDVAVTPGRIEPSFERIEEAAFRIVSAGAVPVGFGGDGSVSLPLIRAAARRWPNLAVLHVDSHTDAYPYGETEPYTAATQFTHAALEQRIAPSVSYHVGLRGSTYCAGAYDHTRALGYNLITMRELMRRGQDDVLKELHERLAHRPVYLSWDMDVFDPSVAPGVCSPTWGGFTAREGIDFLRGFAGMNIVAVDINTVSPPHDVNGMAAFLAAHMTYECLLLLAGVAPA